jgi:hypothetical protein
MAGLLANEDGAQTAAEEIEAVVSQGIATSDGRTFQGS